MVTRESLTSIIHSKRVKFYGFAILSTLLMLLLRLALTPVFGFEFPFITVFAPIALTAWYGGLGPGLLAAALGFLAGRSLFFSDPISLATIPELVLLLTYSLGSLTIVVVGTVARRATDRARKGAKRAIEDREELRKEMLERQKAENQLRRTVEQLQSIYTLSDAVIRAPRIEQIYEQALSGLKTMLNLDRASVLLFDADGVMRFKKWFGLSEEYRKAVEGHSPWSVDETGAQPIVVPDVEADAELAAYREVFRAEGIRALGFIPLVSQSKLLGKFMLYYDAPHEFSEEEIRLARTVASHVSFAIERMFSDEERKRLLEREKEARADAENANRLKDRFLATLSHELRNPLNVILGYSHLLERNEAAMQLPEVKSAIEVLSRNAEMQKRLVNELLDLSRLQMGKLNLERNCLALAECVSEVVDNLKDGARDGKIDLILEVPAEPLFVDADPLRLRQITWNLLNNALKFTKPGGSVKVKVDRDGASSRLLVKDNGTGMSPESLPYIFEIFSQADGSGGGRNEGMGIGLSVVRELVNLHNGRIMAASDGPGRGSEFTVWLPIIEQDFEPRNGAKKSVELPTGDARLLERARILLVDDSEDMVEMLRILLEHEGAMVSTAHSAEGALELLADREVDLIVTDISMPEMDGYSLLREIRRKTHLQKTPVIALTGMGQESDIERAREEGFSAHITKPVELNEMINLIASLLEQ